MVLPSERLSCCRRRDARAKDRPGDVRARRTGGGAEVCAERESVRKHSCSGHLITAVGLEPREIWRLARQRPAAAKGLSCVAGQREAGWRRGSPPNEL